MQPSEHLGKNLIFLFHQCSPGFLVSASLLVKEIVCHDSYQVGEGLQMLLS